MKTNEDLQRDVRDAIKWEPLLHDAEIVVEAKYGVVTLSGTVDSYDKKTLAEEVARHTKDAVVVIGKVSVKLPGETIIRNGTGSNPEILKTHRWILQIPSDRASTKVDNRELIFNGNLRRNYQRDEAVRLIRELSGLETIPSDSHIRS